MGTVLGITAVDALDETELPFAFMAITVNVYEVPLLSPVKVHVSAFTLVQPAGGVTAGEDVTE